MGGFGLTEDQEAIRDGVAKLCADFDDDYPPEARALKE